MKKFIPILILTLIVSGCSNEDRTKPDPEPEFSAAEQETLQVLNGSFEYFEPIVDDRLFDRHIFQFESFEAPMFKKSMLNDVSIKFMGNLYYYLYYSTVTIGETDHEMTKYYFYLNTSKKQIVAYAVIDGKEDYFNPDLKKTYDYTIVNEDTIKLFDTDLSDPHTQARIYTRITTMGR